MSYWVEVHCDVRSETPNPSLSGLNNGDVCHSLSNNNPATMIWSFIGLSVQRVQRTARKQGWVKRQVNGERGAWVCPHCQKFPPSRD